MNGQDDGDCDDDDDDDTRFIALLATTFLEFF